VASIHGEAIAETRVKIRLLRIDEFIAISETGEKACAFIRGFLIVRTFK
jgi:hypothetical protein